MKMKHWLRTQRAELQLISDERRQRQVTAPCQEELSFMSMRPLPSD
jgi:hypothetical protein